MKSDDRSEHERASGKLSQAESVELSRQIAGLANAGLPLAGGLIALGAELPRGRLRRAMNELAGTLESGTTLDQALAQQGERIPPHLRGFVTAGLRSGRLGDTLTRFSEYVAIGAELERRLWLSLAYPMLTICTALALLFFVCVVVVGRFEAIYEDFSLPLPALTVALLTLSRVVNMAWPPVVIVVAIAFLVWVGGRLFLPPPVRRSLAGQLPLIGRVWRASSLAEFCHLLALLLESRLPLPEALRLTGEGVQNSVVDRACREMANSIESGQSFSQAMAKARLFPLGLPRLVRWAENHESLAEVLHMAGAMFESLGRSYSSFVATVLNVICVLLVLQLVWFIPALFLPLVSLLSILSG